MTIREVLAHLFLVPKKTLIFNLTLNVYHKMKAKIHDGMERNAKEFIMINCGSAHGFLSKIFYTSSQRTLFVGGEECKTYNIAFISYFMISISCRHQPKYKL